MDELVKAVDHLGNSLVALAQAIDANGIVSEQAAMEINGYFAAFEEHMSHVEGSMREAMKED